MNYFSKEKTLESIIVSLENMMNDYNKSADIFKNSKLVYNNLENILINLRQI